MFCGNQYYATNVVDIEPGIILNYFIIACILIAACIEGTDFSEQLAFFVSPARHAQQIEVPFLCTFCYRKNKNLK